MQKLLCFSQVQCWFFKYAKCPFTTNPKHVDMHKYYVLYNLKIQIRHVKQKLLIKYNYFTQFLNISYDSENQHMHHLSLLSYLMVNIINSTYIRGGCYDSIKFMTPIPDWLLRVTMNWSQEDCKLDAEILFPCTDLVGWRYSSETATLLTTST